MNDSPNRWVVALAGAVCVLSGVTASALFLPRQALWIDEAVQLDGLSLGPAEQVRWLGGWSRHESGLPGDRMPPLSYWTGWVWSRAFGRAEAAMRWLGVVESAGATLLIFLAARRAWGLAAGVAAGLLFALSPNVVVDSVEIRAYPLFLLTSAATFHALTRFADDPAGGTRWLAALTACCLVSVYTHFFGVVLSGGVMLAALGIVWSRGGSLWPVLGACGLLGVASLGLVPFVTASLANSTPAVESVSESGGRLRDLLHLVARIVVHPSLLLSPAAVAAALAGAASAGAAALAPKGRSEAAARGLVVAWASGALAVAAAQFATRRFSASAVSYNTWMLPAFALLLGSGVASRSRPARGVSWAGLALLIASYAFGDAQLAARGSFFAHTAFRSVEGVINRLGPGRIAIVHEVQDLAAWHIYYPVRYEYRGGVAQYVFAGHAAGARVADFVTGQGPVDPAQTGADYLVVVRSAVENSAEITDQIRGGIRPLGDGPAARTLKADGRWTLVGQSMTLAYVAADIDVFRRTGAK